MTKNILKRVALGVAAITIAGVAFGPASAALAAQSNGSQQAAWLVDTDTEVKLPSGPSNIIGFKTPATLVSDLQTPAKDFAEDPTATAAQVFLSKPGDELTKSKYIGYAGAAFGKLQDPSNKGTRFIYVTLDDLADGPASGDVKDIKVQPGTYSLGFVYTNNNGNQIASGKGSWVTIHVTNSGQGDYYYDEPQESGTAPIVTSAPGNQSVIAGGNATFTAAASGTPAPSVQWESKTGSAAFAPIAGATSGSYTVTGATAAQNGTQYRAVFTNATGSTTTSAATLTVKSAPVEPTGSDAGKVTIPAPAAGASTVVIPTGAAAGTIYRVFAWSEAQELAPVTVDGAGNATVNVSSLPVGQHTIALTESNLTVAHWGTFEISSTTSSATDVEVEVTTSNKFALEGVASTVDLGEVKRGATTPTKALGAFTVTDDRDSLLGWTLTASASNFANTTTGLAADAIDKANLSITPKKVGTAVNGVTVVSTPVTAASSVTVADGAVGSSTMESGSQFDVDLAFAAPSNAVKGVYNSTLTLTLVSK